LHVFSFHHPVLYTNYPVYKNYKQEYNFYLPVFYTFKPVYKSYKYAVCFKNIVLQ